MDPNNVHPLNVAVALTTPGFPDQNNALFITPRSDGRVDLIRNGSLFPLNPDEQAALLQYLMDRVPLEALTAPLTPLTGLVP